MNNRIKFHINNMKLALEKYGCHNFNETDSEFYFHMPLPKRSGENYQFSGGSTKNYVPFVVPTIIFDISQAVITHGNMISLYWENKSIKNTSKVWLYIIGEGISLMIEHNNYLFFTSCEKIGHHTINAYKFHSSQLPVLNVFFDQLVLAHKLDTI